MDADASVVSAGTTIGAATTTAGTFSWLAGPGSPPPPAAALWMGASAADAAATWSVALSPPLSAGDVIGEAAITGATSRPPPGDVTVAVSTPLSGSVSVSSEDDAAVRPLAACFSAAEISSRCSTQQRPAAARTSSSGMSRARSGRGRSTGARVGLFLFLATGFPFGVFCWILADARCLGADATALDDRSPLSADAGDGWGDIPTPPEATP